MNAIESRFEKIGARVKLRKPPVRGSSSNEPAKGLVRMNVLKDKGGTYFDILKSSDVEVEVLDIQPKERHLLVMARIPDANQHKPDHKHKFLCGHDERDWFVAAVPENRSVSTVSTAMESLKPKAVLVSQSTKKMKAKDKKKRHTEAYLRQGEWFFIPVKNMKPDENMILKNEPLRRGRAKPHVAEYCYRSGGETVYVNFEHPNGITAKEFNKLPPLQRKNRAWRVMQRDANVYVRGYIRHSDHKTLHLDGWHKVEMNTEAESVAMRHVAFLD